MFNDVTFDCITYQHQFDLVGPVTSAMYVLQVTGHGYCRQDSDDQYGDDHFHQTEADTFLQRTRLPADGE